MHPPSVDSLVLNYPSGTPESVTATIGGTVKSNFENPSYTSYKNTCAIRVSRALNFAGQAIPRAGGGISNPFMADHKIRTDRGADQRWYIYSTYDIRAYFLGKYGPPKRFAGTAAKDDLANVKGIVAFGFYHVDVWDGKKCAGHDGGFNNSEVHEILVWPCP
jgi:type VI secretion system (T6SS) effector Tae4 (amidase)